MTREIKEPEFKLGLDNDEEQQRQIIAEDPGVAISSLDLDLPSTHSADRVEEYVNKEKPHIFERARELGQKVGITKTELKWGLVLVSAGVAVGTAIKFINEHKKEKKGTEDSETGN